MARKRTITTVEENLQDPPPPPEGEPDPDLEPSPEELVEQNKIEETLEMLDAAPGSIVRIFRRPPGGLKFTYCIRYSLDEFKSEGIDGIAKTYGGGDYQAKVVNQDGKFMKFISFQVDHRIKGELDRPGGVGGNGDSTRILQELDKKDQSFGTLMLQMMQMQQQQAQQNQAMMLEVMRRPQPSAVGEFTKILTPILPLAIELIKSRAQDSTDKTISMLLKAKELFGGGVDGGGDGSPIERMLAQFAPVIAAKLAGGQAGITQPSTQPTAPPETASQASAGQLTQGGPEFDPNNPEMIKSLVIKGIRGHYPTLLKAAQKGTDPQSYFDVLLDELEDQPAQVTAALLALLKQPDWVPVLFGVEQVPFAPWFEKFRQCFLEWEIEQSAPEPAAIEPAKAEKKSK